MSIPPVAGVYGLYPFNDNINKMRAKRCKIQITLKLLPQKAIDLMTSIIFRVCVWSCIIS